MTDSKVFRIILPNGYYEFSAGESTSTISFDVDKNSQHLNEKLSEFDHLPCLPIVCIEGEEQGIFLRGIYKENFIYLYDNRNHYLFKLQRKTDFQIVLGIGPIDGKKYIFDGYDLIDKESRHVHQNLLAVFGDIKKEMSKDVFDLGGLLFKLKDKEFTELHCYSLGYSLIRSRLEEGSEEFSEIIKNEKILMESIFYRLDPKNPHDLICTFDDMGMYHYGLLLEMVKKIWNTYFPEIKYFEIKEKE